MKKQILLPAILLLGIVTTISSCKKNNDDAVNPSKQACTVERKITDADSTQFTYDSDNRIIKEQRFNNAGNSREYTLYTYSSNKIVEKHYNGTGSLTSQVDYHLNSNNNVSYSVSSADGTDYNSADTTWYEYDSDKHNKRRVTKHTTVVVFPVSTYDTTWYTYTGGNLTKKEVKTNNGSTTTTIYTYGHTDGMSEFMAPENSIVTNLYGDSSSKLPSSMTEESTTTSYIYETNSEGYVTRRREIVSGTTTSDEHYTYNCR